MNPLRNATIILILLLSAAVAATALKPRESLAASAPKIVLAERASEIFELSGESPYMLLVANLREDLREPVDWTGFRDGDGCLGVGRERRHVGLRRDRGGVLRREFREPRGSALLPQREQRDRKPDA